MALLGFEPHENLYLQGARWVAASLPATIARGPFLIGFREPPGADGAGREPVIHVDMAHPRVVAAGGHLLREGEPVAPVDRDNVPVTAAVAATPAQAD